MRYYGKKYIGQEYLRPVVRKYHNMKTFDNYTEIESMQLCGCRNDSMLKTENLDLLNVEKDNASEIERGIESGIVRRTLNL